MQIAIDPAVESGPVQLPRPLGFGRVFTRRMFTRRYEAGRGWLDAAIGPYRPLSIDAAAQTLHYGQAIFEGTKAYPRPDGRLQLFRPDANAARFNQSARRLAMPEVDPADFVSAIETLVALEREWVPRSEGASLYIRPVMIATEATLEVRASREFLHYVILSPADPYFASGFQPVSVRVEGSHVRAAPGGTGAAKTLGNYAASLAASEAARAAGYQQVLWLDAAEHRFVEEAGAMNVAFVYGGEEIVTPALTGSILPGVTRDSVLRLAPDLGFRIREARLALDDVLRDIREGRITEAFCMGTAAVIAPIGRIGRNGEDTIVGRGEAGPVARRIYDTLVAIQYGQADDPYGWTRIVDTTAIAERSVA
ncbi:MAG: branched-chain amino acid aminotransferase [Betaproteobacteria bacterium]|nr:branched-chain amino acid aminotransferase [Betaproteobacteria bacterium]